MPSIWGEEEQMKEYFKLLNPDQNDFILKEFGIGETQIPEMDEDALYSLYDRLCDIEVDETIEADEGSLSERGKMAVSIVDVVGNAMAEAEGLFDL